MICSRVLIGVWLFAVRLTFLLSWSPSHLPPFLPNHQSRQSSSRFDDDSLVIRMTPKCDADGSGNDNHNHNNNNTASSPPLNVKRLLCVRHGVSVANEEMSRPGNQWGDPNFRDDGKRDAPLSEAGRKETQEFLKQQFHQQTKLMEVLDEVELVIVSPLTRTLETLHYGVEPILMNHHHLLQKRRVGGDGDKKNIPILAVPLLRERVYTTSDTGRPASLLAREFPTVDFSECPQDDRPWWYVGEDDSSWEEWRPHGENQWYGVRGEPETVFQERMKELDEWIGNRPEKTILMVAHWGVLRHLSDGTQFLNAEAKILEHSFCPIKKTSVVAHL